MTTESSVPPPPPSGGAAKYVVISLVLVLGGGGTWYALSTRSDSTVPPKPPPKAAARPTALVDDSLEIPEEEPDAGVEEAEEPEETTKQVRRRRPVRDTWTCSGDLPPAEIRNTIRSSYSAIRSCYERRLKSHNMLQGNLNLQVKVGGDGHVVATRVRGSLRDADVRSCVQGQARNWTFPAPQGDCVIFDAPYNFTPKN